MDAFFDWFKYASFPMQVFVVFVFLVLGENLIDGICDIIKTCIDYHYSETEDEED